MNDSLLFKFFIKYCSRDIVRAIYSGVLAREPDENGLTVYATELIRTGDLGYIIRDIVSSCESWNNNFYGHPQELVRLVFRGLLDREPEAEVLETYSRQLIEKKDLPGLLATLGRSHEHWRNNFYEHPEELVRLAFNGLLEREPEAEALETYSRQLIEKNDLAGMIAVLGRSKEHWKNHFYEYPRELVRFVFEGLLGRKPETEVLEVYSRELIRNRDLRDLIGVLSKSDAHWESLIRAKSVAIVSSIFVGITGRVPQREELTTYANRLHLTNDIGIISEDILRGKFFVEELDASNKLLRSQTPMMLSRLETSRLGNNESVFLEGFYPHESEGFAWSRQSSTILVKGLFNLYLSCNYLALGECRKVRVHEGCKSFEVTLDDIFGCFELKIDTVAPVLIRFSADGYVIPEDAGINSDARALAFQIWTKIPPQYYVKNRPVDKSSILCVADAKKELDSVKPIHDKLIALGLRVEIMSTAAAILYATKYKSSITIYLIASATSYFALFNNGCSGLFIYAEHGVSPLKKYTYASHYKRYDLILLPGEIWTRRLGDLYPEIRHRCRTVGYPKLQAARKLSESSRRAMCDLLGLDDSKAVILFAPSWSGGDRDCGLFNLRYFNKDLNLLAIPHDGDVLYSKEHLDLGYRVHHLAQGESISDYYHLADILISDISSTAIEFAALGKAVLCISMPRIPDFDLQFIQADGKLQIPYTELRWDFCQVVDREDAMAALNLMIHSSLGSSMTPHQEATVKAMVADLGEDASNRSAEAVIAFLRDILINSLSVEKGCVEI